jgi:Predicted enzyme related to lactoylglutathione lyase
MSRVIHFEIPSSDPKKSIDFYKKIFGWEINQWDDQPYWLCKTGNPSEPGINGAIIQKRSPEHPVVNSIGVKNIQLAVETIEAAGGIIVVPVMAIKGVCWVAYFKDPDGNIIGVTQMDSNAK